MGEHPHIDGLAADFRPLAPCSFGETGQAAGEGIDKDRPVFKGKGAVKARNCAEKGTVLLGAASQGRCGSFKKQKGILQETVVRSGVGGNNNQSGYGIQRQVGQVFSRTDQAYGTPLSAEVGAELAGETGTIVGDPDNAVVSNLQCFGGCSHWKQRDGAAVKSAGAHCCGP